MSFLYSPYRIKNLELKNRIVMPPMCMYSTDDSGLPNEFHVVHYAARAIGGVGLIIQEATAVERRGRITNRDLGLWDDSQIEPLRRLVESLHTYGAKVGVQLAHAGRKCSAPGERIVAPSAIRWSDEYPVPHELNKDEIQETIKAFGRAAKRAVAAGYDLIEVHGAHGYLIHEFLSPLSNNRTDEYGGKRENRVRLLQEVLAEVRANIPPKMPLIVRLSVSDYLAGGLDLNETIELVKLIRDQVDMVHVSSGGLLPAPINLYPGYQVGFSAEVRRVCKIPTIAVGLISQPDHAESIVGTGQADLVALGRELLRNPHWPLLSAKTLRAEVEWPIPYKRANI